MLWAPAVVLSHRPQQDAGGEHPSADDKRLMMSGPQAFFFFPFSFEALPLQWEGERVMLLAFVAAHLFSGTFSPQQWHTCVAAAWLPLLPLCSRHSRVCLIRPAALRGEGWTDPGEANSRRQLSASLALGVQRPAVGASLLNATPVLVTLVRFPVCFPLAR